MKFPSHARHSQGFALVIALSLMAFVLLLLLSITTLVQVESRSSSIHQSRVEARQAALLGLNVALGKLQETAGADQRITARGDLISDNNGTPIADPSRKYLTGVWDTTDRSFKGWLASTATADGIADPNGLLAEDDIEDAPVGEVIRLLQTKDQASVDDVVVSKVRFGDGYQKYAYWIADEGIKARSNLLPSEDYFTAYASNDVESAALRASLGAAQSTGVDLLPEFAPIAGKQSDSSFRSTLRKLGKNSDLEMLGLLPDDLRELSHDLTSVSYGLMTNTKDGGLKTDLSLGFEHQNYDFDQTNGFNNYLYVEENYSHLGGLGTVNVRGPAWQLFQDHYNLYKEMSYTNGIPSLTTTDPTAHGLIDGSDIKGYYDGRTNFNRVYEDIALAEIAVKAVGQNAPSATGFTAPRAVEVQRQAVYLGYMVIVSVMSDNGKLVTVLNPVAIFWNPYNVKLTTHKELEVHIEMKFGIEYLYDGDSTPDAGPNYKGRINTAAAGAGNSFMRLARGTEFDPGQIRLLAIAESNPPVARPNVSDTVDYSYGYPITKWVGYTGTVPDQTYYYLDDTISDVGSGDYRNDGLNMPSSGATIYMGITTMNANFHQSGFYVPDASKSMYQHFMYKSGALSMLSSGLVQGSWEQYGTPENAAQQGAFISEGISADSLLSNAGIPQPVGVMYSLHSSAADINRQLQTDTALEMHLASNPRSLVNSGVHSTYMKLQQAPYTVFKPGMPSLGDFDNLFWDSQYPHYGLSFEGTGDGQNRPVTWEFPTIPLTSLAQLQHVFFSTDAWEPSYAVGNSFALPYVRRDEAISTVGPVTLSKVNGDGNIAFSVDNNWTSSAVDHSYLINNDLWDNYFFSSIAPEYRNGSEVQSLSRQIDAFIAGDEVLLNSRMKLYLPKPVDAASIATKWKNSGLAPEKSVAANIMVEGAFNVNSTSETAWKVFLGGLYEQQVVGMELADGGGSSLRLDPNEDAVVFSRFSVPTLDKSHPRSSKIQNNEGGGYRSLDTVELDALAREMVKQVRQRGPFLTLGQFVNRTLINSTSDSEGYGLMGPLQQAINDAGLNDAFDLGLVVNKGTSSTTATTGQQDVFLEPEAGTGNSYGLGPGYLTQADVLNSLGPFITVKSNTFTIRSYGEVEDPITGNIVVAYYEAIVQQVPDFIDSTDFADTDYDDLTAENQRLGRRFEIVRIRELTPEEI